MFWAKIEDYNQEHDWLERTQRKLALFPRDIHPYRDQVVKNERFLIVTTQEIWTFGKMGAAFAHNETKKAS